MLERRSPQLVLVSTAGDGGSTLLLEDRDAAIAQLADPDTARILLLEWSAPPEAYPDDREAWRAASPHWTPPRLEALEHAHATTRPRPTGAASTSISGSSRRAPGSRRPVGRGREPELELPPRRPARSRSTTATAIRAPAATSSPSPTASDVLVTGRAFPSRRALWAELEELVARRRGLTLLLPASFEKHVANLRGVTLQKVGTAEQRAGYGPTLAAIVDDRLPHDGDDELTRQMLTATPVTIPDVGTTLSARRSPGPIFLARAAVWAIGYELRPGAAAHAR